MITASTKASAPNTRGRAATSAYAARGEKITPATRAGRLLDRGAAASTVIVCAISALLELLVASRWLPTPRAQSLAPGGPI